MMDGLLKQNSQYVSGINSNITSMIEQLKDEIAKFNRGIKPASPLIERSMFSETTDIQIRQRRSSAQIVSHSTSEVSQDQSSSSQVTQSFLS